MPWVQIAGIGLGLLGGRSARRRQRKAERRAQALQDREIANAERLAGIGRDYMTRFDQRFLPLLDETLSEARRSVDPDYGAIAADIANTFGAQRGAMRRNLQRYGISPSDGMTASELRRSGNAEATAHVLARNTARRGARGQRLNNLMSAYGLGNNLLQTGVGLSQASRGVNANAANFSERQAERHGADAANTASGIGQLWGQFMAGGGSSLFSGGGGSGSMPGFGPSYGQPGSPGSGAWGTTMWPSSRRLKTNIEPVDTGAALDAVLDMPTVSFRYKPGAGMPGPKIGTIAERAPAAISNGVGIDPMSHVGLLQASVQELARRTGVGPSGIRTAPESDTGSNMLPAPTPRSGGGVRARRGTRAGMLVSREAMR